MMDVRDASDDELRRIVGKHFSQETEEGAVESTLGSVSLDSAVAKCRQILESPRKPKSGACLRKLSHWVEGVNAMDPDASVARNAALADAERQRLQSEEAEAAAIATQAQRDAAEAAAKAVHDKAKKDSIELEKIKAEARLRARVGRPPKK